MPSIRTSFLCPTFVLGATAFGQKANIGAVQAPRAVAHVVALKSSDRTPLKATYVAATKHGPGVLLLHQSNRDRKSWDGVAAQLALAGFSTLTLDLRGFGESGGAHGDFEHMP